jgi:hypothetical protein
MTEYLAKSSVIFWPEDPIEGVAEKPIVIEMYNDCIQVKQVNNYINIQYDSIKEFVKLLKQIKQPS